MYRSLDPYAEAVLPVAWAGEERSLNWLELAREYPSAGITSSRSGWRWRCPGSWSANCTSPVLDTFMRALPFRYNEVEAEQGTLLRFRITGDAGGVWFLVRRDRRWELSSEPAGRLVSEVEFSQEIAWRIFTKGIAKEAARPQIAVTGDRNLGLHILNVIAVMA